VAAVGRSAGGARMTAVPEEEVEHFDGIPEMNDQVVGDIRDYAAENPERVAEVIQSWIREIDVNGRETVEN
jgi:flagellar biosynthesis/type III secretory pathway M-ring protein FliF/YscJ